MADDPITESTTLAVSLLSDEQREMLSMALFPDTHTNIVRVLEKERTLRPLPIKWAKQVHAVLAPFHEAIEKAGVKEGDTDLSKVEETQTEVELLELLIRVGRVLATYYKWEDVVEALDEEELTVEELQELVVTQQNLQSANDFLLMGLRVLVGVMQQAEIQSVRMMTTLTSGIISLSQNTSSGQS